MGGREERGREKEGEEAKWRGWAKEDPQLLNCGRFAWMKPPRATRPLTARQAVHKAQRQQTRMSAAFKYISSIMLFPLFLIYYFQHSSEFLLHIGPI